MMLGKTLLGKTRRSHSVNGWTTDGRTTKNLMPPLPVGVEDIKKYSITVHLDISLVSNK